ncbi:MAG: hypothetical protein OK457_02315 [Thaumarchaeota archaeon]|nr:hypothetical protein [Nitrososphaerota archaeon]
MASEALWGGYVLYILEIFVPGIGFGELFRFWRKGDSLVERLGIYLGLGLSIDTIVLMVRTSKLGGLSGIEVGTIYGIIAIGFVALAISVVRRRRLNFPRPTRPDLFVGILLLIQVFMLLAYFAKYPIFPEYQSQDYSVHVTAALALISGGFTSIPGGVLYYGVHYQLASGILLVGGEPLITARYTMAILVILSQLLFFSAAKRIFSDSRAAIIASTIYVLSGTIWFGSVFNSGLYANFYGILSALILLIALNTLSSNFSYSAWVIFLITAVNAYFSHYTLLTLIPAILFMPLLHFLRTKEKRSTLRDYLVPAIILVVPAIVPLVLYPGLGQKIIQLASSGGGALSGGTTLSNALSAVPVLGYLALEIYDDYAFIVMIILIAIYLYKIRAAKDPFLFVPIIWFLTLIVAAPVDTSAWRFSFEALVPLTLMASYGLSSLLPESSKSLRTRTAAQKAKSGPQSSLIPRVFVILVFFGAIIIGSWGQSMVVDASANTGVVAQSQASVYNAIYWLRDHTDNTSKYLSVSDWRFTFTNLIIGRICFSEYARTSPDALKIAANESANYIIVTNVTTLSLPPVPQFYPWNNFANSNSSNLALIYQDSDVKIFHIVNGS